MPAVVSGLTMAASGGSGSVDRTLRVGVFGLFKPVRLELQAGPLPSLLLEVGEEQILLEGAQRAQFRLHGTSLECRIREYVILSRSIRAGARGGKPARFLLSVPGRITRNFSGTLQLTASKGILVPTVIMDAEMATGSAAMAESSPDVADEALRAQVVATRSYYLGAPARHLDFDFCDTTHCQLLREPPDHESRFWSAVASTRGLVLAYANRIVPARFSASCGGRTTTLAAIELRSDGYPYFAVDCAYCKAGARHWERRWSLGEAEWLLKQPISEA
ncbi:MAG: hypothetical protein HY650_00280 [Acidobacteria bacterium]|nr:hypothetical protein [Acidobacteriota bacterium]